MFLVQNTRFILFYLFSVESFFASLSQVYLKYLIYLLF